MPEMLQKKKQHLFFWKTFQYIYIFLYSIYLYIHPGHCVALESGQPINTT